MLARFSKLHIIFTLIPVLAFGQVNSFLSTKGVGGQMNDLGPRFNALGYSSVAIQDSLNVGLNPANYANFSHSGIEMNLNHQQSLQQINSLSRIENGTWMPTMRYAIPIYRGQSGLAFGMSTKYSSRYDFQDSSLLLNGEEMVNRWRGTGELNNVFVGVGINLMPKNKVKSLALGANINYLYGKSFDNEVSYVLNRRISDNTSMLDYSHYSNTFMSGSNYNLGLSFSNDFIKGDTIYRFTTAMTFQPAYTLNTQSDIFDETGFYDLNKLIITDKDQYGAFVAPYSIVNQELDKAGIINMPSKAVFGLSLAKVNNGKIMNFSEWLIAFEASFTQYSALTIDGQNEGFADQYRVSGGFEYRPKKIGFKKPITYRIGALVEQDYFVAEDDVYYHAAGSVGAGFPLAKAKNSFRQNFSKINIALTLGRRDNFNIANIRETYGNFLLGLTISNKWFERRKFK